MTDFNWLLCIAVLLIPSVLFIRFLDNKGNTCGDAAWPMTQTGSKGRGFAGRSADDDYEENMAYARMLGWYDATPDEAEEAANMIGADMDDGG